jgi:hypothetical protein
MAFSYGKVIYSERVYDRIAENGDSKFYEFVNTSMIRHLSGDCGLYPRDVKSNMDAIANNQVVISSFIYRDKTNIRIITEPDRTYTTIKIAEEN